MRQATTALDGVHLPRDFWYRVAGAGRRLLLLDYDGTLVPFRKDRRKSRPSPQVAALLSDLAASRRDEVAVLSGRPLEELIRFLGTIPIPLVAEHGWDLRHKDGGTVRHPLPPRTAGALRRALELAEAAGLDRFLERKRTSLALHTRGLPAERAEELEETCRRLWEELALDSELSLTPMTGGFELRATGRNKGTALRELLDQAGPDALAVYLGDDFTDEDAFREVERHGFGIRVGAEERTSLAAGRIGSCGSVVDFLQDWRAALNAADERRAQSHE